jgi:hypothetical protein
MGEDRRMQNNAKVGGILSIVAGGLGCLSAIMMVLLAIFFGCIASGDTFSHHYYDEPSPGFAFSFMMIIYAIFGIIGLLISILAIIGGVYGIKKKYWGFALTGAIASVLAFYPCGIAAVIFITLGKPEFNAPPVVRP